MKLSCIIVGGMIAVSMLAVCAMVKFATDITVEERRRDESLDLSPDVQVLTRSMAIVPITNRNELLKMAERFPYLAAITRNASNTPKFSCFGTLILMKWILTSAHCKLFNSTHRVLLLNDLAHNYTRSHTILYWRIHDEFHQKTGPKFDIALAKLNINRYNFAIRLSVFDNRSVSYVQAAVWKTLSTMNKELFLTDDVNKFDFKITNNSKCSKSYGHKIAETATDVICVDLSDYEDCFIHDFGPLYAGDKVVGVLSEKPFNCENKFAIFTNISHYAGWIKSATDEIN